MAFFKQKTEKIVNQGGFKARNAKSIANFIKNIYKVYDSHDVTEFDIFVFRFTYKNNAYLRDKISIGDIIMRDMRKVTFSKTMNDLMNHTLRFLAKLKSYYKEITGINDSP